jgi:O-antigen/teichoic acid export membrane protein
MLMRHTAGYFGSALIQTAAGIGMIAVLTRLLDSREYGLFALSAAILPLAGSVLFFWARAGISRHLAGERAAGGEAGYLATIRQGFVVAALVGGGLGAGAILIAPVDAATRAMLWASLVACLIQGALLVNLEVHRARLDPFRYFWLLGLQSALGFALGTASALWTSWGAAGVVWAIALSCIVCVVVDRDGRGIWISPARAEPRRWRAILAYGLPITATMTIDSYMGTGDRLVMSGLADLALIGAYAAAQTLANRSILVVASAIGSASVPLAVAALAEDGAEAARARLAKAIELMLALVLPMTVGLGWLAVPVATLMIGEELRGPAATLLPFLAAAALLNGLTAHYINHAFQLAERPAIEMLAIVPAALVGLACLLILVPRFQFHGAAAAAVATQGTYLVLSLIVARRVFAMPWPWRGLAKITVASAAMVAALAALGPAEGPVALFAWIAAGAGVYGAVALALDLAGVRGMLGARLASRR